MPNTAREQQAKTDHAGLRAWVDEVAALTRPDGIYWCDGSAEEYDRIAQTLIASFRDVGYNTTTSALCEHVDNAIE